MRMLAVWVALLGGCSWISGASAMRRPSAAAPCSSYAAPIADTVSATAYVAAGTLAVLQGHADRQSASDGGFDIDFSESMISAGYMLGFMGAVWAVSAYMGYTGVSHCRATHDATVVAATRAADR
jgi:hypothetical protein